MEESREYSRSLRRKPEGPLTSYLDDFSRLLSTQGYARTSISPRTRLVADFSRWLKKKNVTGEEITPDHADRYLGTRAGYLRPAGGDASTLKRLLELLRKEGLIEQQTAPTGSTPAQCLLDEYASYLRRERELMDQALRNYLRFARCFLTERFGSRPPRLSLLNAADVVRFVQHQAARQSPKTAKLVTTALRSFLRYARYRGYVTIDLAAAVPTAANWSMAPIPRSISPDHAQRILAHCARESTAGCRDYAILLLLARLGLRANEVAFLELEDINWEAGCLSVRGKGGHRSVLPLATDVGEAIAAYLQVGRPASASRYVFLRAKAPIRGFTIAEAVGLVVRRAFARAGIDSSRRGAHQFRHALACQMLRKGASLLEIGEILRHRSPQTTAMYAKVDLDSLRPLALPWPGGVR
jgi:integrase/recombinase XerD